LCDGVDFSHAYIIVHQYFGLQATMFKMSKWTLKIKDQASYKVAHYWCHNGHFCDMNVNAICILHVRIL
jgi:hypothetical protein